MFIHGTAPGTNPLEPFAPASVAPLLREPSSIMMAPESIDYTLIDPGVRRLVRWLNEKGYPTTDSGDGVTKPADGDEDALTTPHAYIRATRESLIVTADRLARHLVSIGVDLDSIGPDDAGPSIQASYDPANRSAIIALCGVSDADLPPEAAS